MKRATWMQSGLLAIAASAFGQEFSVVDDASAGGFEVAGDVAIVSVCGPLALRGGWFWDSYDAIKARVSAALASPARAVVLELDSPGGEVAGAFETSREIRRLAAAAGKPLFAFTQSIAASAAYALACSAERIFITPTGFVGSVGVINALAEQTKLDQMMGLRFLVYGSGARKTDGCPHVAITDDASDEMRAQVDSLAKVFFAWVAESRGVSASAVRGLEAAQFHGDAAVKARLADEVVETKGSMLARVASLITASTVERKAAMADEEKKDDEKKEEAKSYEDEMRAKLKADADSDDKDKAAAAKKMLAALDSDGDNDGDKPKDDEKKEPSGEDEKKEPSASASANVLERLGKVERENAELKAKTEKSERETELAKRPDLTPSQRDYLMSLSFPAMKAALAAFPPPPVDPAAALKAKPAQGFAGTDSPRLPPDESNALALAMGLRRESAKVHKRDNEVIFPAMTPDEARAQLGAAKEGAK